MLWRDARCACRADRAQQHRRTEQQRKKRGGQPAAYGVVIVMHILVFRVWSGLSGSAHMAKAVTARQQKAGQNT